MTALRLELEMSLQMLLPVSYREVEEDLLSPSKI